MAVRMPELRSVWVACSHIQIGLTMKRPRVRFFVLYTWLIYNLSALIW